MKNAKDELEIKVLHLRQNTEALTRRLEEKGLDAIQITHDFYWNISKDELFDMAKSPTKPDVGQLSDERSELLRVLSGEKEAASYDFIRLASILRAIGEDVCRPF